MTSRDPPDDADPPKLSWRDRQKALGRSQVNMWLDGTERALAEEAIARHRAGEAQPDPEAAARLAGLEQELAEARERAGTAGKELADLKGELAAAKAGVPDDGFSPFAAWAAEQIATLETAWTAAEKGRKASLEAAAVSAARGRRTLLGVVLLAAVKLAAGWWWMDYSTQGEIDTARAETAAAKAANSGQARKIEELEATVATLVDERNAAMTKNGRLERERNAARRETAQVRESVHALYAAFVQGCIRVPLWQQEMVDHCKEAARLHAQGR